MRRILALMLCLCFVCRPVFAEPAQKYVVLTFDDGPSGRFTRKLLEGLEQRQIHATFLLCGYRIAENPALAERILNEGHEIGLHGYSHKKMSGMSKADIKKELSDTLALLPEEAEIAFVRPPGGMLSPAVLQAAKELQLGILNWSVDPRDWETHDAVAVEQAVIGDVQDGDVILLHDMCDSSVEAALFIVDALLEDGYCFVTASELAQLRNITPEPGRVYKKFP